MNKEDQSQELAGGSTESPRPAQGGCFVPYEPPYTPIADDDPAVLNPTLEGAGIKIESTWSRGWWRRGCCDEMRPDDAKQAWVEDSVRIGDPWRSIIERHRAYNIDLTAWCVGCATRLLPRNGQRA